MDKSNGAPIRIVLVDDHQVLRGGLRMLIESQAGFRVVGEAGSNAEAIPIVTREDPDIILLDLDLRGENGLDLLPHITSCGSKAKVLVLTGLRDPEMHRNCVRFGARGLIHKEAAYEVLMKAIRKVHEGEVWFDRSMISSVLTDVLNHRAIKEVNPEAAKLKSLTDRELQVIALVCEGLRNKPIAERLSITDTTVRHHLSSIFSKLDVSDRLELVIYAYRQGLATPPDRVT
jgi:two-component system, NarL family, nitrate/nitrite response regulator NarL